jgi:hypothetical protein
VPKLPDWKCDVEGCGNLLIVGQTAPEWLPALIDHNRRRWLLCEACKVRALKREG